VLKTQICVTHPQCVKTVNITIPRLPMKHLHSPDHHTPQRPSGAQRQVRPASSVMLRERHLMASLRGSDFNCGLLQLPLGRYFLCQRVKPQIPHSLSNCTDHPSGNAVKKDAVCYTPSVSTPQSGQGVVSHATPARCFCSLKSVIVV